jgi:YbbR domain-containing protein
MSKLLYQDFGWKLFSLLLAAFIWYTVQKIIEEPKAAPNSPANIEEIYTEVPVAFLTTAADRRQFQAVSNTVSVTVSGPPTAMNTLQRDQIHALVNTSGFDPKGRHTDLPVEVSVPAFVTVLEVTPASLQLQAPSQP